MKTLFRFALLLSAIVAGGASFAAPPPNIILILADDLGYSDLGCFGARDIRTPNLDRMATEGVRFTSFYVAQAVCSASRAALLTGCYPNRVGITGGLNVNDRIGIHENETLLPELLKARGYATALVGKWHLGHLPKFNPIRHGFDEWFGLPYSNDMWPGHPVVPGAFPPLPLMEGSEVIETNPDQTQLTRRYTERALKFIERHRARPFFLYLAHAMPHVPVHASDKFRGRSAQGLYGDAVEELDASTGEILAALAHHQLDDKTLVIFLSDNGPWLSYGNHAGKAGPFRGGKLTTWEGGVRIPCIMRWPGRIPSGSVCDEMLTAMEMLPTLAHLAGAALPAQRIDGKNAWSVITAERGAKDLRDIFYYYQTRALHAVRRGQWKLHAPHDFLEVAGMPGRDGKPAGWTGTLDVRVVRSDPDSIAKRHGYHILKTPAALYDLQHDPGETRNVIDEHPDIVKQLQSLLDMARDDLGDSLTQATGKGLRKSGNEHESSQP